MPLAVAAIAKSQDWVIGAGFDRLNLAANAVTIAALFSLLGRWVTRSSIRVLTLLFVMLQPYGPFRFSYYYPLLVDASSLACLTLATAAIEWWSDRPTMPRLATVTLLVACGVLVREIALVAGLGMWLVAAKDDAPEPAASGWWNDLKKRARLLQWVPLAVGAGVLVGLHLWITPLPSDYTTLSEVRRWISEKSLQQYVVALFLVFGPVLTVAFYRWRSSARFLMANPALAAPLGALLVLAWIGGSDTERLLVFATPVVAILIARALESIEHFSSRAVLVLLILQTLAMRPFMPIGGPVQPPVAGTEVWERLGWAEVAWFFSYENMWSRFCPTPVLYAYTAFFSITAVLVVVLLRNDASPHTRHMLRSGW